jgi:cytochrome c
MAWYHSFDGGRAFYTELGHTDESYADPLYLKHLLGGIQYAIGKK